MILAVSSFTKTQILWFYIFSALLFQPFLKVDSGRELWMFLDESIAVVFIVLLGKGHFKGNTK